MSGHSRWSRIKDQRELSETLGGSVAVDNMIQFVQGYILAMEDVLRDIENMQYDAAEAGAEYFNGYGDALDSLKRQAEESRDSARRTLDVLTKKVDDAAE